MSDVFSWLRGCHAGRLTGNAAYAHPVQVRLWPLALDVIEAAENELRSAGADPTMSLRDRLAAFFAAAERERT